MGLLDPDRVDELVRVYREHNDPQYSELACFAGVVHVLEQLRAEGRRLGVVTAKRRRASTARSPAPASASSSTSWSRGGHGAAQARTRAGAQGARAARREAGGRGLRRRLAVRRRRRARCGRLRDRGRLGRHPPRARRTPTRSSRSRRSCLASSKTASRAAELRTLLKRYGYAYHVLDEPEVAGRRVRPPLRRAARARARPARARDPAGLADAARRRAAVGQVPQGRPPRPDGLAREGDDRRGARSSGPTTCQAAGPGRARHVRARAEDRRARDQPHVRGRRLRARRDARRRLAAART